MRNTGWATRTKPCLPQNGDGRGGKFPQNNAVAYLSLQVIESGDKGTAEKLLAEMEKFKPAEDETGYYNTLKSELQKVGGEEL